jgi:PAS domain S-box-containing protein
MSQFDDLRQKAEQILSQGDVSFIKVEDIKDLLHELNVRQIELEIQNDELRASHETADLVHQHLLQLYHQAPIAYISLDEIAMILEANQTFAQLLEIPLSKLIGKSLNTFIANDAKNAFILRYKSFYHHPHNNEIETILQTHNNKNIYVRLNSRKTTALTNHHKKTEILLVSVTDLTEIKLSQQKLEHAKEEAERANKAKSIFLSQMSHNLRTPLNAILGFGQILQIYQDNPLSDDQSSSLQHILDAGQLLLELINDLLILTKIESGRLEIKTQNVSVHGLLEQIIGIVSPIAAQANVDIYANQQNINLHVQADPTRLKEVLLNLLSNAIKYNCKGGSIELNYQQYNNGSCRILIHDTGIGIKSEQQKFLFQPFERLGMENSTIQGTGIGLNICKRLMEAMNGSIGVKSHPGLGSTFWIELPLGDNTNEELLENLDTQKDLKAINETHQTILYVEDNALSADLMRTFFMQHEGLEFLHATHPQQALELVQHTQFDLILLDIQLPEMSGFELFKLLKMQEQTQHIPVIAVSAYAMPEDIIKAKELGFYDYITKPVEFAYLISLINNLFS